MVLHQPTLTTERLILRPFRLSDAPLVMEYCGDRAVYEPTLNIPHPYVEGMAEKWIATHASDFYDGRGVTLAMTLKGDDSIIGAIGLMASKEHNRAEMGYWVAVPYWGNGYCSEAAVALIAYGFDTLDYHKITAHHMVENPASGRVMEKAGMTFEAELRDHCQKDGRYHTVRIYSLLRE